MALQLIVAQALQQRLIQVAVVVVVKLMVVMAAQAALALSSSVTHNLILPQL